MDMDKAKLLEVWIDDAKNIVFLGGAGVSTESGIPDFRGKNGLYKQKRDVPFEVALSHDFYKSNPSRFYDCMREIFQQSVAIPNAAHYALAELEQKGKVSAVITQNIDGLHQLAGSKNVLELHGNAHRFYCERCGKEHSKEYAFGQPGFPRCECGGVIRPDVVLFGEGLDSQTLESAVNAIRHADMMIVGGTSLTVFPAAGLIDYFRGEHLVIMNETPTPGDAMADLVIRDPIAEVFSTMGS